MKQTFRVKLSATENCTTLVKKLEDMAKDGVIHGYQLLNEEKDLANNHYQPFQLDGKRVDIAKLRWYGIEVVV